MRYEAFVAVAAQPSWAAVVLAALGSSALGAIVGGSLTTWLRGRIERDEAWRTRLVDSAAELGDALSALMICAGQNRRVVRQSMSPTEDQLGASREAWRRARTNLTLVELLFTRQSSTFQYANDILRLEVEMRRALSGRQREGYAEAVGITVPSDPYEAAAVLYDEAVRRFDTFADEANEHIRSTRHWKV